MNARSVSKNTVLGFTLVELIVVIAIMAILAVLAAPSLSKLIAKQKLNQNARDLASALSNARSQSAVLRRNVTLNIAPSSAVTVTDTNKVWQPTDSITVTRSGTYSTTTPDQIIFTPAGGTQVTIGGGVATTVSSSNTIRLCNSNFNAIVLSFSVVGSVSQTQGTCS